MFEFLKDRIQIQASHGFPAKANWVAKGLQLMSSHISIQGQRETRFLSVSTDAIQVQVHCFISGNFSFTPESETVFFQTIFGIHDAA